jgi:glycosyltransferase involved in cell wall biosynthesis
MNLVLAVDALTPPLSGIGRYTCELVRRLQQRSEIESLRFYRPGCWVEGAELLNHPSSGAQRGRRLKSVVPVSVRHWWCLKGFRDHVFHGPNYLLPPFAGPSVATVHDLSILKFPETHPMERRKVFEREFHTSLERASHLIAVSKAVRDEIVEEFSWPIDRITPIPHGVSKVFAPRPYSDLAPSLERVGLRSDEYVLCVSTIEPRKGIEGLLEAYSGIAAGSRRRYPLVIVGHRGWLSESILEVMDAAQRAGWLRYFGYVDEAELPFIYAGARAFVYPSIYEGFGLPVLEAMASGVPVLTSNCSSLSEVTGGAAILVEPLDIDALRLGIEKVTQDERWRAAARQRGLQVAAEHSWDKCIDSTLAVYQKVGGVEGRA